MWESVDNVTVDEIDREVVASGEKKTSRHLQKAAICAADCGLPSCIVTAMFSKSARLNTKSADCDECLSCGLPLGIRNSFSLTVESTDSGRRVLAKCQGCQKAFLCGELEQLEDTVGKIEPKSEEVKPAAVVPQRREKPRTALNPPSLQKTPKTGNKRRGSALQRLLQEEESESDRSLSGFLNQFSM